MHELNQSWIDEVIGRIFVKFIVVFIEGDEFGRYLFIFSDNLKLISINDFNILIAPVKAYVVSFLEAQPICQFKLITKFFNFDSKKLGTDLIGASAFGN